MKLKLRKFTIFALVTTIFSAAIFCCCLTNMAEAEEALPSCHQTHDIDTQESPDDCECEQTLAILEKESKSVGSSELPNYLRLDRFLGYNKYSSTRLIAYHDPPFISDPTPLYIKHSILRI